MQIGLVAQWLEQGSHKPQVLGSIPSGPIQQFCLTLSKETQMLIEKLIPTFNNSCLSDISAYLSPLPLLTAPQAKALPHRNAKHVGPQLKHQARSNRTVVRHK